jgi:hypothetical protein
MFQETANPLTNQRSLHAEARLCEPALFNTWRHAVVGGAAMAESASPGEDDSEPTGADAGLEDAARAEHDYLHQRLREELQREPTEQELDEWLRRHTEGY